MGCKFCNRENTKYSCIFCGCYRVCNVCAVPVYESKEGYDEQNYQEKDVVTQSIKQKGKMFGSFLIHGMFRF